MVCIIENSNLPHPDLIGNAWFNHQEIPNNDVDDDLNGYVDDFRGWNPNSETDEVYGGSHGTQVAGMIGATGNNEEGVAGANWAVKMMVVFNSGANDEGVLASHSYPLTMRRLYHETNGAHGAFVVATNASWGINGGQPMLLASGPGQVTAAQERARAAAERVRPLSSLAQPRIDVELRQRLWDRTTPQVTTEQQHSWSLVARWDFPVGGEQQARIAESRLRAQAAQEEAQRVANALSSELASLGPRIAETANNVARLERQIRQYDLLVQAGELQFEDGRRTVSQLIQLREGRFTAEQRRAEQAHRHLTARLRQLALNGALLPALGLPDAEVPPAR